MRPLLIEADRDRDALSGLLDELAATIAARAGRHVDPIARVVDWRAPRLAPPSERAVGLVAVGHRPTSTPMRRSCPRVRRARFGSTLRLGAKVTVTEPAGPLTRSCPLLVRRAVTSGRSRALISTSRTLWSRHARRTTSRRSPLKRPRARR